MDVPVEEELNYEEEINFEEDVPEDDLVNDSQSKDCTEDGVSENSKLSGSDDQYLQIDYLEDDSLVSSESLPKGTTAVENEPEKDQSCTTAVALPGETLQFRSTSDVEKNEKSKQENVSSKPKGTVHSNKSSDNIVRNGTNRKNRGRQFHHRQEFKKKFRKEKKLAFSFNSRLAEYQKLAEGQNLMIPRRELMYKNQINQKFYPLQTSTLPPPLMSKISRFRQPSTFVPSAGMGIGMNSRSFPQPLTTASLSGQIFSCSNYGMANGQTLFSSFGYPSITPSFFLQNNAVRNPGVFDQNQNFNSIISQLRYGNNFQINGLNNGALCNPIAGSIGNTFCEQGAKKEGRLIEVQHKSLKKEEKRALMLKKEARLKRFMNNNLVITDNKESAKGCSLQKVQLLQKNKPNIHLEEQQKENSSSSNDQEVLQRKPDINKELLLKKVNPFDEKSGTSDCSVVTKVKQSIEKIVKEEPVDSKPQQNEQFGITKAQTLPNRRSLVPVKKEIESPVKFVRTISKSFDELTFGKLKTLTASENTTDESPSQGQRPLPSAEVGEVSRGNLPKQMEPQLTGCIVKVLNIPPSTTTNDILALCSPIGIVMEVKLNFPKENSVVIRFAEPTCAENFFSLYHGQKMNNYFLNVIVV